MHRSDRIWLSSIVAYLVVAMLTMGWYHNHGHPVSAGPGGGYTVFLGAIWPVTLSFSLAVMVTKWP